MSQDQGNASRESEPGPNESVTHEHPAHQQE